MNSQEEYDKKLKELWNIKAAANMAYYEASQKGTVDVNSKEHVDLYEARLAFTRFVTHPKNIKFAHLHNDNT